jgi:transposase-like protein
MMPLALLEQLQGAGTDVLRRVLEHAMQRLIEAEAATQIGAGPHERSASRTTYRNGYRERILDTGSGRLELQVPKLRTRGRAACASRSSPQPHLRTAVM